MHVDLTATEPIDDRKDGCDIESGYLDGLMRRVSGHDSEAMHGSAPRLGGSTQRSVVSQASAGLSGLTMEGRYSYWRKTPNPFGLKGVARLRLAGALPQVALRQRSIATS